MFSNASRVKAPPASALAASSGTASTPARFKTGKGCGDFDPRVAERREQLLAAPQIDGSKGLDCGPCRRESWSPEKTGLRRCA